MQTRSNHGMKRTKTRKTLAAYGLLASLTALSAASCERGASNDGGPASPQNRQAAVEASPTTESQAPLPDEPEPLPAPPEASRIRTDFADRWLHVDAVPDGATGGWATANFAEGRNKLSITTSGVQAFSIDARKLRIDWDDLVILGIDSSNSELRRRDAPVLHFELDRHGKWIILEEPAAED